MTDLKDLKRIPGVGPSIADDLVKLGIGRVEALVGRDPNLMYETTCQIQGEHVDRCVLYVYRCAVYFAENEHHGLEAPDPDLLLWWNWKDRVHANERVAA